MDLWGIWNSLLMEECRVYMKIVVQVDIKRVASELQEKYMENDQGTNILRKIHVVGNNFEELKIEHILR